MYFTLPDTETDIDTDKMCTEPSGNLHQSVSNGVITLTVPSTGTGTGNGTRTIGDRYSWKDST